VRIITAKSSLGLEFKAVLILWVQQFGVGNEAEGRRELYVSMTRAQQELHLFGSGNFQVLQNLKSLEGLDSREQYPAIA
jgi:superfamily I DNA/RNA helicase